MLAGRPRLLEVATMKKFSILALIAGVQVVAAVGVAGFAAWNVWLTRTVARQAQAINMFQSNKAAMDVMIAVSADYSRTNPAIDPLLMRLGVKKPVNSGVKPGK
jgi:hypothetical protein